MPKVKFSKRKPAVHNRFFAEVSIEYAPTAGSAPIVSAIENCEIDTASDYLILPVRTALSVGLSMARLTKSLLTPGGLTQFIHVPDLTVHIEGVSIVTDVMFDTSPIGWLLLGRPPLLRALKEVAFNSREWMWR